MRDFMYEGLSFKPIRQLRKYEDNFKSISKRISSTTLTPKRWNVEEFYKVATEHNAGNIDLFEVNNIIVIPAENFLFEFK